MLSDKTIDEVVEMVTPRKPILPETVRAFRERRGWTHEQMADAVGAMPLEVAAWEAGAVQIPGEQAQRIRAISAGTGMADGVGAELEGRGVLILVLLIAAGFVAGILLLVELMSWAEDNAGLPALPAALKALLCALPSAYVGYQFSRFVLVPLCRWPPVVGLLRAVCTVGCAGLGASWIGGVDLPGGPWILAGLALLVLALWAVTGASGDWLGPDGDPDEAAPAGGKPAGVR